MLIGLLVVLTLVGIDASPWVWAAVVIGEPIFWLTVAAMSGPPDGR